VLSNAEVGLREQGRERTCGLRPMIYCIACEPVSIQRTYFSARTLTTRPTALRRVGTLAGS
jgi:hypothetical protein